MEKNSEKLQDSKNVLGVSYGNKTYPINITIKTNITFISDISLYHFITISRFLLHS